MRLTSYIPALDMLTSPLVLLSKPVGPIMSFLRRQESLTFLSKNLTCTEYFDYAQYELGQNVGVPKYCFATFRSGYRPYMVPASIPNANFGL